MNAGQSAAPAGAPAVDLQLDELSLPGLGPDRQRALRWAGPLLIALALLGMLLWTWHTAADPLVDFGREAYVAWQLSAGQVLYRDISYFNGPLSPYLNALWFRLFGAHLETLAVANALIFAGVLAMMYRLAREMADRFSATVGCLLVVLVLSGLRYMWMGNSNWICPYSHEMTHGVALALAGVYALWAYQRSGRWLWLAASGLAVGLCLLTKVEVALSSLAATTLGVGLVLWVQRPPLRRAGVLAGLFAAAVVLPPLVAFGLLWRQMPAVEALLGAAGSWRWALDGRISGMPYYRWMMGVLGSNRAAAEASSYLAAGLKRLGADGVLRWNGTDALLRWIERAVAVGAPALVLALLVRGRRVPLRLRYALAAVLLLLLGAAAGWWWADVPWLSAPGLMPLVVLAILIGQGLALWRKRADRQTWGEQILPLVLGVLALLLMGKIILKMRYSGYGFGLGMPATVLAAVALLTWVPAWVRRHGGSGLAFGAVALAALFGMTYSHVRYGAQRLGQQTTEISTPAGTLLADSLRGPGVNAMLRAIDEVVKPDQTIVVLPEGVMLNFLAQRRTSIRSVNFMPPEMIMFGEAQILQDMQAHPPDYVVLVHETTEVYGLTYFGRHYARDLYRWVQGNYRSVYLYGNVPLQKVDRWGIQLLRYAPGAGEATLATTGPATAAPTAAPMGTPAETPGPQ